MAFGQVARPLQTPVGGVAVLPTRRRVLGWARGQHRLAFSGRVPAQGSFLPRRGAPALSLFWVVGMLSASSFLLSPSFLACGQAGRADGSRARLGDWVWLQRAERRAPPALVEVTQCSLPAAATGGSSEFPTGNELQLQAESGLRVWAPQGPSTGPEGHPGPGAPRACCVPAVVWAQPRQWGCDGSSLRLHLELPSLSS